MTNKNFFNDFINFFENKFDNHIIYDLVIKHIDIIKWEQQILRIEKFKEMYPEKKKWKRNKSTNNYQYTKKNYHKIYCKK